MQKAIFFNKGYGETGKSSSIKAVFRELTSRISPDDVIVLAGTADANKNPDIKGIVRYRGIEIGIESEGDPKHRQPQSVREFSERGCTMIVCACRTKGETRNIIDATSKRYNYKQFAIPHFCLRGQSKDLYSIMNKEYAESVVRWIDWWIDNK